MKYKVGKSYNIQSSYLNYLLKVLKNYDYDETVYKDIYTLETLMTKLKNNFCGINEDFNAIEQLISDTEYFDFYRVFYPFVRELAKTGVYFATAANVTYKSIYVTNKDTVKEVKSFFKKQGSFFYEALNDYLEDGTNHLKFIKPTLFTEGEMYFLRSTGDTFVISPNHSNITKLTNLSHEFEHVIDAYHNQKFSNNVVIREAPPMFIELIACDYFAKKYNLLKDGDKRKLFIHSLVKNYSYDILEKNQLLYLINKYKDLNYENLLSLLKNKYHFEKASLNFWAETSITEDYYYQISYLIAIELYCLYQNNKVLALYILQELIFFGNDDNILDLLSYYNISLNKNLGDYEIRLCKSLKI